MIDLESKQVLGIVHEIHEASLDPRRWGCVLQQISNLVGAQASSVWIHDFGDGSSNVGSPGANLAAFVGFDTSHLQSYAEHYSFRNVWAANEDKLPPGRAVSSTMLYPDAALKGTEFYDGWLRQQDLFYSLGCVVEKERSKAVKMSFLRSERQGTYDARELGLIQLLLPHLRLAIEVHRRMHRIGSLQEKAFNALDALNFGVVLLSAAGTFVHWNQAAQAIARRSRAIGIDARGKVHARSAHATERLRAAIEQVRCVAPLDGHWPGTALRLPGECGHGIHVSVVPAANGEAGLDARIATALFITEPDAPLPRLAASLRTIYQMSPAEAALAEALAGGQTLQAYAEEKGVTLNTVKTQLKAVAAKVGAKRQVDVVRAILTGPAVLQVRKFARRD